jgi:hypothetical protein
MNDNAFNALAHEQRRTLLLDLLESNPQDAGVESATGASTPTDAETQAQIAMYHSHLPKLEDYGYIKWDKHANEVVKGSRFEEIRPLLEFLASNGAE